MLNWCAIAVWGPALIIGALFWREVFTFILRIIIT